MGTKHQQGHDLSQGRSNKRSWPLASLYACSILALSALTLVGCPSGGDHLGWTYAIGEDANGESVSQVSDGGFFVVGAARQKGSASNSPYLLAVARLSPTGSLASSQLLDGLYGYFGVSVPDGGAIVAGVNTLTDTPSGRLRVVRLDGEGNSLWDRTYGQELIGPRAILSTLDGGCVVAGYAVVPEKETGTSKTVFVGQAYLFKLNSSGDVLWERHYRSPLGAMGTSRMASVGQNGFILVGVAAPQALRVDADGNELWWNTTYTSSTDAVGVTSDGGFVIAGVSNQNGPEVPAVIRTDANGAVLWEANDIITRAPSSHYTVHDALVDGEGRIVLIGKATKVQYIGNFFPNITEEAYIMQMDSSAKLNWYKGLGAVIVNSVALTSTGDYVTVGSDGNDLQVIRVTTDGTVL